MTIEPNELHAIKASVAAFLAGPSPDEYVDLRVGILDAIDQGAANAAARNVIMFDCETGDEIQPSNSATGPVRVLMAAQLLPGMPPELVDKAYSEYLDSDHDPRPFGVGKVVSLRVFLIPDMRGVVVKRVEGDSELHTVWVRWSEGSSALPYSPRELEEVTQ